MNIGENIKYLRQQRNMRQADLAKLLGYSQNAICAWERGKKMPPSKILVKMSDIFNVSIDTLLKGELCLCKN